MTQNLHEKWKSFLESQGMPENTWSPELEDQFLQANTNRIVKPDTSTSAQLLKKGLSTNNHHAKSALDLITEISDKLRQTETTSSLFEIARNINLFEESLKSIQFYLGQILSLELHLKSVGVDLDRLGLPLSLERAPQIKHYSGPDEVPEENRDYVFSARGSYHFFVRADTGLSLRLPCGSKLSVEKLQDVGSSLTRL